MSRISVVLDVHPGAWDVPTKEDAFIRTAYLVTELQRLVKQGLTIRYGVLPYAPEWPLVLEVVLPVEERRTLLARISNLYARATQAAERSMSR